MGQDTNTEVASTPTNPPPQGTSLSFRYPADLAINEQYPHILHIEILARVLGPGTETGSTDSSTRVPSGKVNESTAALTNYYGSEALSAVAAQGANIIGIPLPQNIVSGGARLTTTIGNTPFPVGETKVPTAYGLKPVADLFLHISDAPAVSYGAEWASKNLGLAGSGASLEAAQNIFKSLSYQEGEGIMDYLKNLVGTPSQAAGPISQELLDYLIVQSAQRDTGFGNFGTSFNVQAGFALNPFKAQAFSGHPYRTFSFKYKFLPKNKTEAETIKSIILLLKYFMHGTYDGIKIVYPGEFRISHKYNNTTNSNLSLFKTKNCALTKLDIVYGEGDYVSFSDGSPVETNLTMTFTELELLSSTDFVQGSNIQNKGY